MKNYHLKRESDRAVSRARNSGDFPESPGVCSKCNEDKRVVAHHEDYAKPLDVVWMCGHCHQKRHHELRVLGVAPMIHPAKLPFPDEYTAENLMEIMQGKRKSGRRTIGAIRSLYRQITTINVVHETQVAKS